MQYRIIASHLLVLSIVLTAVPIAFCAISTDALASEPDNTWIGENEIKR